MQDKKAIFTTLMICSEEKTDPGHPIPVRDFRLENEQKMPRK